MLDDHDEFTEGRSPINDLNGLVTTAISEKRLRLKGLADLLKRSFATKHLDNELRERGLLPEEKL